MDGEGQSCQVIDVEQQRVASQVMFTLYFETKLGKGINAEVIMATFSDHNQKQK